MRSCFFLTAMLVAGALSQWPAAISAQESRFEIGMRGLVLLGKGTPANDMLGEGLIGRFALSDAWRLGIALDGVTFDYETPNRALGIPETFEAMGVSAADFEMKADYLADRAFEDQCTTANPRMPLVTELAELYRRSFYGHFE